MNSKERVQAALKRDPVDRVPIYMWFHPETAEIIADSLEIHSQYIDEVLGNDIKQTWVNNNYDES